MQYKPLEDYGIIGDLHTAALVGADGSIDWCCLPDFDSPSVFAAILDAEKGGRFSICAEGAQTNKQLYAPGTNVLVTRFSNPDGVAQLTDFMPISALASRVPQPHVSTIVRQITAVRGTVGIRMVCRPAFNYARTSHQIEPTENGVYFNAASGERLYLAMPSNDYVIQDGAVVYEFSLAPKETASFVLHPAAPDQEPPGPITEMEVAMLHQATIDYWQQWLSHSHYTGRWREMVERSLLTLKLLTYAPTGAIVAAPTCSLPEDIGGVRNWDYRYTWLRDAAFTVYALMRVGMTEEAAQFMHWLEARTHEMEPDGTLRIMYSVRGDHDLRELTLPHLEGYKSSRPVRIGNDAHRQLQLDTYGALMDSIYLYNKYGKPISYEFWQYLTHLLDWVCDHWRDPDEGIWEVRGGRRQFVHSKLMCWVALDRGIRLADKRSFPADRHRWLTERDAIYLEIMERGWSQKLQAFVQFYDSESLDAANLLMPLVFFMSPTDPRMLSTIDATMRELTSDSLVHRYKPEVAASVDGMSGGEGTFSICTFWLVEALTRAGRLPEARFLFERMLGYANHLGLYSEQIGFTGEALGNFPQAFTHLSLISAAYNLNRTLDKRQTDTLED